MDVHKETISIAYLTSNSKEIRERTTNKIGGRAGQEIYQKTKIGMERNILLLRGKSNRLSILQIFKVFESELHICSTW